jgi:hypothetical protein
LTSSASSIGGTQHSACATSYLHRRRTFLLAAVLLLLFFLTPSQSIPLHIGTDPRIELLTTVQLLSGYSFLTPYYQNYAQKVFDRFSSHSAHQAVQLFAALSRDGSWSDAYPTAMLYLSDPPELEEQFPLPPHIYAAFGGVENFHAFVSALRSFAHQTRFMRFFNDQERHFFELEQDVRQLIGEQDPIATVEAYYGTRQISYHLILSPLLHHGGFGPHIGRSGGPYDVYILLGPTGAQRGRPSYGPRPHLLELVWHEFSHAFVNDLTGDYSTLLFRHDALYSPIAKSMKKVGYTRWLDCANEHVIRAITARLTSQAFGPQEGDRVLRRESQRGFRYIHALAERLMQYEKNRELYPSFAVFYPSIVDTFSELDRSP